MKRLIVSLAVAALAGCSAKATPAPQIHAIDEWAEAMKWHSPTVEWRREKLDPLMWPEDDSKADLELREVYKLAEREKGKIERERNVVDACKWLFDATYKKSPEDIKRAYREQKWGEW